MPEPTQSIMLDVFRKLTRCASDLLAVREIVGGAVPSYLSCASSALAEITELISAIAAEIAVSERSRDADSDCTAFILAEPMSSEDALSELPRFVRATIAAVDEGSIYSCDLATAVSVRAQTFVFYLRELAERERESGEATEGGN